ncbi:hypothetical protein J437_LFUL018709 [Ladona fulva]|uniref:Transposase Tc1-like domain-containing protein n=1 Tax=Ladona fulva TaxID=123851 RepID=A0A8K0KSQ3_LADFU|nr:hypothetical protein J437_LFUL018709 [Ladona fulva]
MIGLRDMGLSYRDFAARAGRITKAAMRSTAASVNMFASTVRRRLLRAGLVESMRLHRLPLTVNHRCLGLQWVRERRHWEAEWQNVLVSDKSRFNLSNSDGRVRVRRYRGERNRADCIFERHSGIGSGAECGDVKPLMGSMSLQKINTRVCAPVLGEMDVETEQEKLPSVIEFS